MRCDQVTDLLPGIMDGVDRADPRVVVHVETCLKCQAELVQYRRLLKVLHQLRAQGIEPPPGLLGEILAQLEHAGERGAVRSALAGRRLAYLAGLAVAAGAAGAAGVAVLLASRGRAGGKVPLAS
ncbi:MAG: anti-sigma factor family protein [Acidimicrobiales bacterium]